MFCKLHLSKVRDYNENYLQSTSREKPFHTRRPMAISKNYYYSTLSVNRAYLWRFFMCKCSTPHHHHWKKGLVLLACLLCIVIRFVTARLLHESRESSSKKEESFAQWVTQNKTEIDSRGSFCSTSFAQISCWEVRLVNKSSQPCPGFEKGTPSSRFKSTILFAILESCSIW